jgi:hypothetical protein
MLHLSPPYPEPKRGPLNLDYRFLALLLFCATRSDLLEHYLAPNDEGLPDEARWPRLQKMGLPPNLLADYLYLFQLEDTQKALKQLQRVTQKLAALNHCPPPCPSNEILQEQAWLSSRQTQPESPAGIEN